MTSRPPQQPAPRPWAPAAAFLRASLEGGGGGGLAAKQGPARLLLRVTVERSLGPVNLVVPPENTVADLIRAAVAAYLGERRRPPLPSSDPSAFELHYSQFSLERLNPEEKLINLGSRSFFLCANRS